VWGILSRSAHYRRRVHPGISRSAEIRIHAIASRSAQAAAEAARDLGIPVAHGSYEALLADPAIEAVYIPLPNDLHAEWVRKAADAGKHVLCEKPFAMDAAEARQAIEHAERRGVMVMEAFMYRFHPQWRRAAELVRIGDIGQVQSIQAFFAITHRPSLKGMPISLSKSKASSSVRAVVTMVMSIPWWRLILSRSISGNTV
jgi:predicted dehydrogenase